MARILSVSVPDELMRETEAIARAQGRTKSEVVRDALGRHLQLSRFRELQTYGRRRAEELGIGPEDAEALVDDVRAGRGWRVRVLCDTNVLVSALIADGPPSRLLEEAIDRRIELVLPDIVPEELGRVLTGKLGFTGERARTAVDLLAAVATARPRTPPRHDAITGDPGDDAILACAVEAGVEAIATGDRRHLLPIGEHRGVRLLTPQAVLAELRAADHRL